MIESRTCAADDTHDPPAGVIVQFPRPQRHGDNTPPQSESTKCDAPEDHGVAVG